MSIKENDAEITFIVVNYLTTNDTIDCIKSLNENYPLSTILVVDNSYALEPYAMKNSLKAIYNNSNDCENHDELELSGLVKFSAENSDCYLLNSLGNKGYGRAINIGYDFVKEYLQCKYFVVLNNDVVTIDRFLDCLFLDMEREPNISCATGKILWMDSSKTWYGGGEFNELRMNVKHYDYPTSKYVSFICGCFMLFRMKDFDRYRFDDDFFMYYEDVDICRRMTFDGRLLFYNPKSIIYHKVSKSIVEKSQNAYIVNYKGRYLFINKYSTIFKRILLFTLDAIKILFNPRIKVKTKWSVIKNMIPMVFYNIEK